MKRLGLVASSLLVGTLIGAYFFHTESFALRWKDVLGLGSRADAVGAPEHSDHGHEENPSASAKSSETEGGHDEENNKVAIADKQIDQSKITVQPAQSGLLRTRLRVPGTIIPDRNRARSRAIQSCRHGCRTSKGPWRSRAGQRSHCDLDSREVADAKSEDIAAIVNFAGRNTLSAREDALGETGIL